MKKIFCFCWLVMAAITNSEAQLLPPLQPEQDACEALILCGNSFTTQYSYTGNGAVADLTSSPCSVGGNGGEDNSMWLRLNVSGAGSIVFTIAPLNLTDDYDFAVLNITNSTCSTFAASSVVRCNFNNNQPGSNVNGIVGLNTTSTTQYVAGGTFGSSFLQQINASAGDVYLIMINNFGDPFVGGPSSGFTIDFTGSTATFNGTNPKMSSVIPSCNNSQQITVQMSEPIKCNSIAADGTDFTVSGGGIVASAAGVNCTNPNGYTDKVVLNFASALAPGNYALYGNTGTDGNTLLNLCDIPLLLPDSILFTIPPYVQPSYLAIDTPACSEIKIALAGKVRCNTIAANGSDFSISGPQASAVIAAYGIACDTLNFTDTVVLILQNPLQLDGIYTITAKNGSDGNTLIDSCGLTQAVGNSISYNINSYDGELIAGNDTILCKDGLILLQAANNSAAPLANVACGQSSGNCIGSRYVSFIGGADTSTVGNSPFSGSFQDARSQYLFLASELRGMGLKPGSISKLEWKVTQQSSTLPYNNLTIKMGCVPQTDMTNGFIPISNTVFTTSAYSALAGWNSFALTTPYDWDGTSNIIVEVCYDNTTSSLSDAVAHSITPFVSVYRRYGNGLVGCNLNNTTGTGSTANTLRPKLRFYICEPPAATPSYTWRPGTFLADSTQQQTTAFIKQSNTYLVTTIDKYGCAHRDTTQVLRSIHSVSLAPMPDTAICLGDSVMLQASGGNTYTWTTTNTATMSCLSCDKPLVKPTATSAYTVVINDQYHCSDTLSTTVIVHPLPQLTATPHDTTVKYGAILQLAAAGANFYLWQPVGRLSDPNLPTPTATITRPDTFVVLGIDLNGCRATDSAIVHVDYGANIIIPSAFSPNHDGMNDVFHIGNVSFQRLSEFRIFNRWGEQVFTTNDPMKGWDGSYKGIPQEAGVYYYVIRLAYPNGTVQLYKGDVTLVR